MGDRHDPTTPAEQAPALLIVIVPAGTLLEAVIRSMRSLGLSGTVVDGKGLTAALNEEMPIFGGLASMLPNSAGTRVLLSATSAQCARDAITMFESEFQRADRPIAMIVPISDAIGLTIEARTTTPELHRTP